MKRYIALAIVATVLFSGWAFVEFKLFATKVEPAMTALNIYTDTLIQQDYQSSYLITSPSFRASISYPALVEYHTKLIARLGSQKNAKQIYWDLETQGGISVATIRVILQFEHGSENYEFKLLKEQDIWRILSYKTSSGTLIGKS